MRFFFFLIMCLSIYSSVILANDKVITEEKFSYVIEKQDMKFEQFKETTELIITGEMERRNQRITSLEDRYESRIESISNAIDRLAFFATFIGILITVVVLYFSFQSADMAEAKVRNWLSSKGEDAINSEVKPIKEELTKLIAAMQEEIKQLKIKSSLEIEELKRQLEEKGNEAIEGLSSKIIENELDDTELSIEDKQYFEYQIKAIKSKPLNKRTLQDYKKMILFYIASKEYLQAKELVDSLINNTQYTKPEKSSLYYLKGLIEEKQNLYDNAIVSLNMSLKYDTSFVSSYTLKAKIFNVEKQDYKEAIKLAKKALEYDIDNYDSYIALGYGTRTKAYFENQHELYEKAIDYNKKAISINPDNDLAYNNIGSIYLIQDRYEEAKEWYRISLERNQNEWGYVNLLRIYLFLGETFPKELEEKYLRLFNNHDGEQFTKYRMFKILEKIVNNQYKNEKEIKKVIDEWRKNTEKLRHYFFGALESWVIQIEDKKIKNNLIFALRLFDKHRIKREKDVLSIE